MRGAVSGFDSDRIARLRDVIQADIEMRLYHGAVLKVVRGGNVAFHEAFGHADAQGAMRLDTNSVFSIFSITKAFVNVLILRAVQRGEIALTTPVASIIPEFAGPPRDRATVLNLLTHTTGIPGLWEAKRGGFQDRLDELLVDVCANMHGVVEPGKRCDYAPLANHVLMATILVRLDAAGRAIGRILKEELFDPLGMSDTSLGLRSDLRPRHVVPDMRGTIPIQVRGRDMPGDYGLFEQEFVEAPHVGCVSTVADLSRFAEMLRGGGAIDSVRILSPGMMRLARRNWTGNLFNELYRTVALRAGYEPPPAYLGLGFNVRGTAIVRHQFGTLTTSETFGNYGAGSGLYWVDPEHDLTFTCLSAGVMSQAANIDRFQRLSDMVIGTTL
jgi:CubicO group peptidase (beta-lactamase class C family)